MMPENPQQVKKPPAAAAAAAAAPPPLLMVCSSQNPEFRYLYDVPKENADIRLNRELHLPQIAGHHCIGSSRGFLFTVELSPTTRRIHATNPLTGATLPLPSTPLPLPLSYPDPHLCPYILQNHDMQLFIGKAVLSSSLTSCFLFFREIEDIGYSLTPLLDPAFASVAAAADDHPNSYSWSIFETALRDVLVDCIFHKGLLYLLTRHGTLATYNLDDSSTTGHLLPVPPPLDAPKPWCLVESPQDDDLFLVSSSQDYDFGGGRFTRFFKVFKLVVDHEHHHRYRWNQVQNIGNTALFVGTNTSYSLSLSGGQFPHLKPNCIYFTPNLHEYFLQTNWSKYRQTGVFNLEDGSIRFYQLHDGREPFDWPIPPVWYMPLPLPPSSSSCN